ncbi:hypothetical protein V8Z74_18235 [Comamonas sp. w2-DMI]|uniref:hypothetical protein n=1 Tax=Comamonas sp. w2-DMI TaxID=3126391 RepID=UPI0032E3C7D8
MHGALRADGGSLAGCPYPEAVIFILTYDAITVRPDSCPRFVDRVAHFPNIQPERQLGTSMKK